MFKAQTWMFIVVLTSVVLSGCAASFSVGPESKPYGTYDSHMQIKQAIYR